MFIRRTDHWCHEVVLPHGRELTRLGRLAVRLQGWRVRERPHRDGRVILDLRRRERPWDSQAGPYTPWPLSSV